MSIAPKPPEPDEDEDDPELDYEQALKEALLHTDKLLERLPDEAKARPISAKFKTRRARA